MTPNDVEYEVFHCLTHKKYIHYFKNSRFGQECMCWDCVCDANLKKPREKYNEPRDEADCGEDQEALRDGEGSEKVLKESEKLGDKELTQKIQKVKEGATEIVKHIEKKTD